VPSRGVARQTRHLQTHSGLTENHDSEL
jgi:hypothetical protein